MDCAAHRSQVVAEIAHDVIQCQEVKFVSLWLDVPEKIQRPHWGTAAPQPAEDVQDLDWLGHRKTMMNVSDIAYAAGIRDTVEKT